MPFAVGSEKTRSGQRAYPMKGNNEVNTKGATGEGDTSVRLQKALAAAGIGSRRACEDLILAGRVAVDGQTVRELGTKVGPGARLAVDGRPVGPARRHVYYLLNKPAGYVSTASDPEGRPTVLDLVPAGERIYPVGRLDYDSEGLLLLTNDGTLTEQLLHPSHELEREYEALVSGAVGTPQLRRLAKGIELDGQPTAPADVNELGRSADGSWLRLIIHEGRNRQVRRMCEAVGLEVRRLVRVRLGPIELGNLPAGRYRRLRRDELLALGAEV